MFSKCVQITISGRVQGVFFRKFTKSKADQLSISGFVKNLSTGSVYIEACGSTEALEKFIDWCHSGPEWAEVSVVDVKEIPLCGFTKFEINYL